MFLRPAHSRAPNESDRTLTPSSKNTLSSSIQREPVFTITLGDRSAFHMLSLIIDLQDLYYILNDSCTKTSFFFNALVNFEILGYLPFYNMLFQIYIFLKIFFFLMHWDRNLHFSSNYQGYYILKLKIYIFLLLEINFNWKLKPENLFYFS